ncbi:MAG: L,D-transpeptidase [Magnetococcales bacterium]|nr:L,D-transpeptidase [Magnetococcales bacterium]
MTDHALFQAARTLVSGGWDDQQTALVILGQRQRIYCLEQNSCRGSWPVSTALNGFGCRENSGCTPVGLHRISDKIGDGQPLHRRFISRQPTHEIIPENTTQTGDFITSRILRLSGIEPALNQGSGVDSFDRYIYIHGTPHVKQLGQPVSAGCIRMRDAHIINLFHRVGIDTMVLIMATDNTTQNTESNRS